MGNISYTIIIPHYNIPDLLQRCLDSIPLRDDIQVIVVDDNSDPSIVDFGNFPGSKIPNVEVYFPKEGKGAGYARNIGLKHAKGEWILFSDADDYFTDNLSTFLSADIPSGVDIIKLGYKRLTVNGTDKESLSSDVNSATISFVKNDNLEDLYYSFNCVPWNKMISRRFLEKHDIKFEEVKYSNDVYFAVQLALNKPIVVEITAPIYIQEERHGSLVNTRTVENYIVRMNVALRVDKLLKKAGLRILRCDNWLYNILQFSYLRFLKYSFKEFVMLGKYIAYSDYAKACLMSSISPNPFLYITNCIRVRMALGQRIKSIIKR